MDQGNTSKIDNKKAKHKIESESIHSPNKWMKPLSTKETTLLGSSLSELVRLNNQSLPSERNKKRNDATTSKTDHIDKAIDSYNKAKEKREISDSTQHRNNKMLNPVYNVINNNIGEAQIFGYNATSTPNSLTGTAERESDQNPCDDSDQNRNSSSKSAKTFLDQYDERRAYLEHSSPMLSPQEVADDIYQHKNTYGTYNLSKSMREKIIEQKGLILETRRAIVEAVRTLKPEMKDYEAIDLTNYLASYRKKDVKENHEKFSPRDKNNIKEQELEHYENIYEHLILDTSNVHTSYSEITDNNMVTNEVEQPEESSIQEQEDEKRNENKLRKEARSVLVLVKKEKASIFQNAYNAAFNRYETEKDYQERNPDKQDENTKKSKEQLASDLYRVKEFVVKDKGEDREVKEAMNRLANYIEGSNPSTSGVSSGSASIKTIVKLIKTDAAIRRFRQSR